MTGGGGVPRTDLVPVPAPALDGRTGGVTFVPAPERQLAVNTWLILSAEDRDKALDEWSTGGVALLRCGGLFGAVRIERRLVEATAGTEDPHEIDYFLARALGGPVFMDQHQAHYYVLVPPSVGRRDEWAKRRHPRAEYLGTGTLLGVPRAELTDADEGGSYWSVPMDGPGDLCPPEHLSQLVTLGQFRLSALEGRVDGHQ
jgi:hypothetical protein